MLNLNSRNLLGLILITCAVLSSNQVESLRCYQCIQGAEYVCDEADMHSVACPTDSQKCGLAYVPINSYVYQWRGCVNATVEAAVATTWSEFGNQILGMNATALGYESCAADLCNMPLKCYFCTAGRNFLCGLNDTGAYNCLLKESSCAKVTYNNGLVWKGCVTASQASSYSSKNLGDFKVSSYNVTATGFYSCTENLCNSAFVSSAFGLATVLVPLVLSIILLLLN